MILPYKVNILTLQYKDGVFKDDSGVEITVTQKMGFSRIKGAYPYDYHQGIDTTASVEAFEHVFPEDVLVVRAVKNQTNATTGFGNYVDAVGLETGFYHRFGHNKEVFVDEGKKYPKGFVFGTEGNTGFQVPRDGWHLHWDIAKDGIRKSSSQCSRNEYISQFVDPLKLVLDDLKKEKKLMQKKMEEEKKEREMIVYYLYRLIFGREPDKKGLENWSEWLSRNSVSRLIKNLANSDEAKGKKKDLLLWLGWLDKEKFYNEKDVKGMTRTIGEILSDRGIIKKQ